jgi:fructose-1,6-bisphosphatase/inositol monophosphatase family enzyme
VDCYRENGIKIWDVAAGLSLVKAAGGIVRINPLGEAPRPQAGVFCESFYNDVILNVAASNAKLL